MCLPYWLKPISTVLIVSFWCSCGGDCSPCPPGSGWGEELLQANVSTRPGNDTLTELLYPESKYSLWQVLHIHDPRHHSAILNKFVAKGGQITRSQLDEIRQLAENDADAKALSLLQLLQPSTETPGRGSGTSTLLEMDQHIKQEVATGWDCG